MCDTGHNMEDLHNARWYGTGRLQCVADDIGNWQDMDVIGFWSSDDEFEDLKAQWLEVDVLSGYGPRDLYHVMAISGAS